MKPADVYAAVTDRILADLRAGTRPWIQSWTAAPTALPLRHGGEPYRGINVLLLWAAAFDRGYASPHWMTYRQAQALGGQVRRGETSSRIFFVRTVERRADQDPASAGVDDDPDHVRVHRVYSVFNADQIDGLPDDYRDAAAGPMPTRGSESRTASRGSPTSASTSPRIPSRACYQPRLDTIRMPPFESFESPEAYYAVLAHESVHATNTPARVPTAAASAGSARPSTRSRSSSPSSARRSCAPNSASRPNAATGPRRVHRRLDQGPRGRSRAPSSAPPP